MFKISTKVLSPMEKCFLDESIDSKEEILHFKGIKGQSVSFQLACTREDNNEAISFVSPFIESEISKYITIREVVSVPSNYPTPIFDSDEYYLRKEIGLYPDPLRPLHYNGQLCMRPKRLYSLWFEVTLPENFPAGTYSVTVWLKDGTSENETEKKKTVEIELIDIPLPKQELIHTEWFYCDCIAEAHHVEVFSEEHFSLLEKYIKTAVKNGINMILTPLFTPSLDTYIGGERLTTQLVKIKISKKNKYEFDFSLAERWVKMCLRAGVEYFEIPHFYTQWGATNTPKFMAEIDGETKKIFGWETDSTDNDYKYFLSQFVHAIVSFTKKVGIDKKCYYHISDEPHSDHLNHYIECKSQIEPYLDGCSIIDALSDFEFYKSGAIKKPVAFLGNIKPFVENKVEGLWTYYSNACAGKNGTGRCLAMPMGRTRILGVLLYCLNIEGFLHWGYNFYHNFCSFDVINPFSETAGEYFAPSGDAFLVYPDVGEPLESLRLFAMKKATEDHRLLKLYESKFGRDKTLEMIKDVAGYELTPEKYPRNDNFFTKLFQRITTDITNL